MYYTAYWFHCSVGQVLLDLSQVHWHLIDLGAVELLHLDQVVGFSLAYQVDTDSLSSVATSAANSINI
jgi:hypothetical protein